MVQTCFEPHVRIEKAIRRGKSSSESSSIVMTILKPFLLVHFVALNAEMTMTLLVIQRKKMFFLRAPDVGENTPPTIKHPVLTE